MHDAEASGRSRLLRALFPQTAEHLDRAYEAHAGEQPEREFDAWLDDRVADELPPATNLHIEDEAVRSRLDRALAAARSVASTAGLAMPEIEAFAEAGIDITALGEAMAEDARLLPVATPHGLGAEFWVRAFDEADGPLGAAPQLFLAPEAQAEFATLGAVPLPAPPVVRAARTSVAAGSASQAPGGVFWTLRLIPAGQRPAVLGLSHQHGPHVSLPEMLMLQLMRFAHGEEPVDDSTFTWLAGELAGGRLAARHIYDAAEHAIRITCREVVSQGPHLGARPPVSLRAAAGHRASGYGEG
jgi:hypothetical protein